MKSVMELIDLNIQLSRQIEDIVTVVLRDHIHDNLWEVIEEGVYESMASLIVDDREFMYAAELIDVQHIIKGGR